MELFVKILDLKIRIKIYFIGASSSTNHWRQANCSTPKAGIEGIASGHRRPTLVKAEATRGTKTATLTTDH
jgi:hypothetical protein